MAQPEMRQQEFLLKRPGVSQVLDCFGQSGKCSLEAVAGRWVRWLAIFRR